MAPKEAKAKKAPKVKQLELPNADAGVVTRFPPEPSGYLHIGHSKAALLNDFFAHTQYPGGKMILRFDDTNAEKENEEYQEAIREDVALLGIVPDQITYTSDYFEEIDKYCTQIIKDGKAFADDTPGDVMSAMRAEMQPSAHRDDSTEDNLKRYEEMKTGSAEGQKWCIRAKISYNNKNGSLRDPVIYRCPKVEKAHHRTGTKFKAYPTYQFACPIVDSIEGVTHALRTSEYNDQNDQYKWMLKTLGLRVPYIWTFSKIQFIRTLMSKRKLTKIVDTGVVTGWDDARMPTIRGLRRRGMTVEGLRDFMVSQGPSKNIVHMDWHTIWAMNKKVIDQGAARFTAIDTPYVKVKINGHDGGPVCNTVRKHAKYDLGDKKLWKSDNIVMEQEDARTFAEGEEVTLMNWGNAIVKKIEFATSYGTSDAAKDAVEGVTEGVKLLGNVASLELDLHLEGDVKTTKKKVTWLSLDQETAPVELVDYSDLLSQDKLTEQEEAEFEKFLDAKELRSQAIADCNVWNIQKDEIFQFDRKGYYRCDRPVTNSQPGVFFKIPSGK